MREKLSAFNAPTNIKIALLWASLMFLYIYNDYFAMYTPGTIDDMAKGSFGPMGKANDALLTVLSIMLAVPSLMIFLSVALNPSISRWLNLVLGIAYTAIEIMTFLGAPLFYKIIVIAEIGLTALIVWHALRWPRQPSVE
jgi:hypothetical protein